jgi:hypothetical protein
LGETQKRSAAGGFIGIFDGAGAQQSLGLRIVAEMLRQRLKRGDAGGCIGIFDGAGAQ